MSASAQADVYIEAAHEGCDMNVKISRTRFEDLCFDLYKAAGGVITKALAEAGSATNDVDMVLLAGGKRFVRADDASGCFLSFFFPAVSVRTIM